MYLVKGCLYLGQSNQSLMVVLIHVPPTVSVLEDPLSNMLATNKEVDKLILIAKVFRYTL